jgi:Type IV pilus assembly protein PilM
MEGVRKWLAFGTGVGVEVREQELQVTIVRVRRSETAVLGAATVTDYKTRPAAEWGAELSTFLRKLGAAHIAATVLLPRRDVIVRTTALPGVSDRDLEAAIRLQIDSLHPFTEDDVYFSCARITGTSSVLVGIARREVVDELSSTFAKAGIKVAAFTFSAAAIYSSVRLRPGPAPAGFLITHEGEREFEIYGESEARPIFSATFPLGDPRAPGLAKSELRLEPETEPSSLSELLPKPAIFPDNHDPETPAFSRNELPYATALAGACPWLSIDGNLLPLEQRRGSSRVRLIPTVTLGTLFLLMLGGLAAQSRFADGRYLGLLQHEISRYEPMAVKVNTIDRTITETRARTQLLDEYRRRPKRDMDALLEVTKLIPPPGWVGSFDLDRQGLQIAGESEQAAGLLKTLDNSPLFEKSEFTMPITRTPSGEAFRIRVLRSVSSLPVPAPQNQTQAGQPFMGQPSGFGSAAPMIPPGFQQAAPVSAPPPILPLPSSGVMK